MRLLQHILSLLHPHRRTSDESPEAWHATHPQYAALKEKHETWVLPVVGIKYYDFSHADSCVTWGMLTMHDSGNIAFICHDGRVVGVVGKDMRDDILNNCDGDMPFVAVLKSARGRLSAVATLYATEEEALHAVYCLSKIGNTIV